MNLRKYRKLLVCLLVLDIIAILALNYVNVVNKIPDTFRMEINNEREINVSFPGEVEVEAFAPQTEGIYEMNFKLFGFLPLKTSKLEVIKQIKIKPYGNPIGIYAESKGLLVLGSGVIEGKHSDEEPAKNKVSEGDYIYEVNGKKVDTIDNFVRDIQGQDKVILKVKRKSEMINVSVNTVEDKKGTDCLGIWVRESTQGIGTLTYVTENGVFGALGHGITDSDTGTLFTIKKGEIFPAQVMGIVKGTDGEPGEIQGYINMTTNERFATLKSNTPLGIFGEVTNTSQMDSSYGFMDIGLKQDIFTGPAKVISEVEGMQKEYDIEIEEINQASSDNKSMVIHVTDPELIKLTGGIIQGMSGSPIIQNNKVIGAVTHVLVDDPTRGYGVFIENMLANNEQ